MTRLTSLMIALAIGLMSLQVRAAPVTYTFDTVHSRVAFYVSHLGFSSSLGQFRIGGGTFTFDPAKWSDSSVSVQIPVKSLDLGDATWNAHVLGDAWLDGTRFPEMSFVSSKVENSDATHGKLYGTLTIKGVSKPVVLDLTLNKAGLHPMLRMQAVGFTATTTVKRSDFGVTGHLGAVGDEVDVRIEVEASVPPM
jgi:polyisoprenoid-binding protein YceI